MMIDSPCPIILFIGGVAKEDWSPSTWKLRNNLPNVVWKCIIRRKYEGRHNKLHCFQPYKNWQLTVEIISYRSYINVIFCNAQLLYRCRRRKVLEYFLNVDLSWDWIKKHTILSLNSKLILIRTPKSITLYYKDNSLCVVAGQMYVCFNKTNMRNNNMEIYFSSTSSFASSRIPDCAKECQLVTRWNALKQRPSERLRLGIDPTRTCRIDV